MVTPDASLRSNDLSVQEPSAGSGRQARGSSARTVGCHIGLVPEDREGIRVGPTCLAHALSARGR